MSIRISEVAVLDCLLNQLVDVDALSGFYKDAYLLAVHTNGNFEILPTNSDEIVTLSLSDTKVFKQ